MLLAVVVVDQAAAWLGPVWGRHGCAAALFGAVSEAGSEAPSWRPCDATLANVLRPSPKIATSKPHGGGDGPRLALVVDRRPLQLRVALVIGVDSCLLGRLGAVGIPLPQLLLRRTGRISQPGVFGHAGRAARQASE